ncbi:von Willebrand factor type A [Methylocaldum marinum]|uniref:von Willebrand factor type A n=1 Tax=Methylocaldum marinum TaxID=1432792 RepID=A0A250KUD5_9GAMM|nr:vWA domain-containing protein [Methylocaldum marinum]BBA33389.1 von Willebrand factor type A [Methylocaldum marinum]
MNLGFDYAWMLPFLGLALLPLVRSPVTGFDAAWNALLPADMQSRIWTGLIRLMGVVAIAGLVLGLAGLHREEYTVERVGKGAHIVLLLDRSQSMDHSFAGRAPSGAEEAKSAAAERLLAQFVRERKNDRTGVAAYSTGPLFVLPLTDNREAVLAAVRALRLPALAQTHIGKGLLLALSYFTDQALTGSRIVVLVSDGAAVVDPDSEQKLRKLFKEHQIRLYWIFLRSLGSPGIFEVPEDPRDDNASVRPERYLHLFFSSLEIPYKAYEAENPAALGEAIADIDRIESLPIHYQTRIPRLDLAPFCYGAACLALLLLVGVKLSEAET